jgi:hypothetical protein
VTLVSGQNLKAGTLLGQITTGGKYTLYNNAASDGSEAASAVLLADCDASGGDATALILVRLAEVKGDLLTWNRLGQYLAWLFFGASGGQDRLLGAVCARRAAL